VSTVLMVLALVVAVVSVPTVAGLTAWGLAGGDGEPKNPLYALLAMGVGFGSMYSALVCYLAFWRDIPAWQWWLMWIPPVAGLLGLALSPGELVAASAKDRILGLGMQVALALPALLLWASGSVTP
jgi:hypothetical protein